MSGWNEAIRAEWAKSKEYLVDEARDRMHLKTMGIEGLSEEQVEAIALDGAKYHFVDWVRGVLDDE